MLTVHECSNTGLFRHLSNPVFLQYLVSDTKNLRGSSFTPKYPNVYVDFGISKKHSRNIS